MNRLPVNRVPDMIDISSHGGLKEQALAMLRTRLGDDEVFVITVYPGGAGYFGIVVYDYWFRSVNHWDHTSSLNNSQSVPNADGTTTYVLSLDDPGIHNWLDPAGLREQLLLHRWQALPNRINEKESPPVISGNIR
ncbi:hypothetical protein [Marinobacter salarius]|uniref:hypothetical protein n=1 Tax=Marinobacter salarius TaxID=1420917 RepID=UPI0032EADECB